LRASARDLAVRGVDTRGRALHAVAQVTALSGFLSDGSVMAAPLPDLLRDGPSVAVWRLVHNPDQRINRLESYRPAAAPGNPLPPLRPALTADRAARRGHRLDDSHRGLNRSHVNGS